MVTALLKTLQLRETTRVSSDCNATIPTRDATSTGLRYSVILRCEKYSTSEKLAELCLRKEEEAAEGIIKCRRPLRFGWAETIPHVHCPCWRNCDD